MVKKKSGWVYGLVTKRKNGQKKIYTGGTGRTPAKRFEEHAKAVNNPNSKTYVGKGEKIKPLGAVWSTNWRKAEQTIKKMKPSEKKQLFKSHPVNFGKAAQQVKGKHVDVAAGVEAGVAAAIGGWQWWKKRKNKIAEAKRKAMRAESNFKRVTRFGKNKKK